MVSKLKNMNTHKIQFRGKSIGSLEWIYGDLCQNYEGDPLGKYIIDEDCTYHKVCPETVGQFVGKLSSGDEVYINDIIQHGQSVRIVSYRNGNTCLDRPSLTESILLSFSENPKKLGNVFDNPELLK